MWGVPTAEGPAPVGHLCPSCPRPPALCWWTRWPVRCGHRWRHGRGETWASPTPAGPEVRWAVLGGTRVGRGLLRPKADSLQPGSSACQTSEGAADKNCPHATPSRPPTVRTTPLLTSRPHRSAGFRSWAGGAPSCPHSAAHPPPCCRPALPPVPGARPTGSTVHRGAQWGPVGGVFSWRLFSPDSLPHCRSREGDWRLT